MSFYRVGQQRKKRTTSRKRPSWDDTIQDLTVYKATPEEVLLRKEAHKSKNHLSVRLEKIRKEKQNENKLSGPASQQLGIMKEILYDQDQLQHVLAQTDAMMAVVKDLFGDDPKKFMGFPNVTTAPNQKRGCSSLVAAVPDIYTQTEKLSDSLMNQSALNDDLEDSDSDDDLDLDTPDPISYESRLNLKHFQDFLQEENIKSDKMTQPIPGPARDRTTQYASKPTGDKMPLQDPIKWKDPQTNVPNYSVAKSYTTDENQHPSAETVAVLETLMKLHKQGRVNLADLADTEARARTLVGLADNSSRDFQTPPNKMQVPASQRTPPSAVNDTNKIKRSKKVAKSPSDKSLDKTATNMTDIKKVLSELETQVAAFDRQVGQQSQEHSFDTNTFSGYTVSLVTAVSRLTRHLREMDLRIRAEVTVREQMTQDIFQLRAIIDALASDLILSQEEYSKLHTEHQQFRHKMEVQMSVLQNQMQDVRLHTTGSDKTGTLPGSNADGGGQSSTLGRQLNNQHLSANNEDRKSQISAQATTTHYQDAGSQSTSQLYPASLESAVRPAAAVMLSPPVRKTRMSEDMHGNKLFHVPESPGGGATRNSDDLPRLSQTPPVINSVTVPKPISLVQTNINFSLPSQLPPVRGHVVDKTGGKVVDKRGDGVVDKRGSKAGDEEGSHLPEVATFEHEADGSLLHLEEKLLEEALSHPDIQSLMQQQIAQLNQKQEEAWGQFMALLEQQKQQQHTLRQEFWAESAGQSLRPSAPVSPPISPIPTSAQDISTSGH